MNPRTFLMAAIAALAPVAPALMANAQPFIFTRVVDTNAEIPSRPGEKFGSSFPGFSGISLSGARVSFIGTDRSAVVAGVYEYNAGALAVVADRSTFLPGSTDKFNTFRDSTITSGANSGFAGGNTGLGGGAYGRINGTLQTIVDFRTDAPGGGKFGTADLGGLEATQAVVHARKTADGLPGIYRWNSGVITTVADTTTAVPGGIGTFTDAFRSMRLSADTVDFVGSDSANKSGIYRHNLLGLNALVNTTNDAPGGLGKYTGFGTVRPHAADFAFGAVTENLAQGGIFTSIAGQLSLALAAGQPLPGGVNYVPSSAYSFQAGTLLWLNTSGNDTALYTNFGGTISRVIGTGSMLDGTEVQSVFYQDAGHSGNQVAISVRFIDDRPELGMYNQAIYLVTIPAPPVPFLLALGLSLVYSATGTRSAWSSSGL